MKKLIALANELPPHHLVGLSNDITATIDADGWARVPYGDHPHEMGLQRFGKAQAEEMVGYFKNTWNKIKRAIIGMPIFRGHPDIEELANQYPDKTSYGQIADMEARDDGLYLRPVLSEDGAALVNEEGLRFFSPHWLATELPAERGRRVFAPAFLVSIGLTDRPNIAGTSLVNSKADPAADASKTPTQDTIMPQWLLILLGLANDAPEETVKTKLNELLARPEPTALANEQSRATTLANENTTLKADVAAKETRVTELETALANERTALRTALVDAAIRDGRITDADKPVWLGRLEHAFANEAPALAALKPVVKTQSRTAGLAQRGETNPAAAEFTALVNEMLPANGNDRDRAWAAAKASAKGKAILARMEPAAAA